MSSSDTFIGVGTIRMFYFIRVPKIGGVNKIEMIMKLRFTSFGNKRIII